jgi:uncharacterized protein (TIGR02594 family)
MITRIFSDIAPEDVAVIANEIEADDGVFSKEDQADGRVTLIVQYPGDPPPEEAPAAGAEEFAWMPVARGEIGIKETPQNNPRISQYFTATDLGPQPETVPWCSAFVNWCVTQAGHRGSGSAMARSWLRWGREAGAFVPGCIVVLSRGAAPKGHVGFYVGMERGNVRLLGGNQQDAVGYASFPAATVLGKRIP